MRQGEGKIKSRQMRVSQVLDVGAREQMRSVTEVDWQEDRKKEESLERRRVRERSS